MNQCQEQIVKHFTTYRPVPFRAVLFQYLPLILPGAWHPARPPGRGPEVLCTLT